MLSSSTLGRGASRPQRAAEDERPDDVPAIVLRAKDGDRDALRMLYLRFAVAVRRTVRPIVGDEHEAEDVTQHVFLKLMTVLHRYEPREAPFAAWLMRVARNVALDTVRQRRVVPAAEVFRVEEEADDTGRWRATPLRDALHALPNDQREVVVLRHVVGLSPREIAGILGRSEASVHGLHHRGRAALRTSLTRSGAAPTVRRPVQVPEPVAA